MIADKPLLLMDIDGVLNVLSRKKAPHLRRDEALGFWLLLHSEHPDWVAELEDVFEVRWATMWQDNAWAFGVRAGFGVDWEYVDFDAHRAGQVREGLRIGNGVGTYKHPGIVAALGDRPGVWIDDDMTPGQRRWARARTESGTPTLFIQPDHQLGMTREHVSQMLAFAEILDSDRMSAS